MRIAVDGASGYQGGLVVAELTRRGIGTVLVGRDAARLREAAARLEVLDTERRVARWDDHGALATAFGGCEAVVNCAGPFTPSGHAVVHAAITAGCHYLDTAGEQLYIKKVFDRFAADADRAGVTIIPAATDGAVPSDLIAHILAKLIEPVAEITTAHTIDGGGPSLGSLRSVLETVETFKDGGLVWEDGDWRAGTPARRTAITFPGHSEATPVVKFRLPEVVMIPRHVRAGVIDSLPDGPAEDSRLAQRFTIVVEATGVDGDRARGVVYGRDTYGTTAVIAVEAAHRLVTDPARPGVLAAAEGYDPAEFLDFLAPHGVRWTIDTADAGRASA